MDEPSILLTNDDGIESAGLRALYDTLTDAGDVTVREHELGYAIEGTPADCTVAGLGSLAPETDVVVAGCNQGANLGAYVLGRSGTVSAAVEATFFDVPAISVSMYIPVRDDAAYEDVQVDPESYSEAARATKYLVERAPETGVFDHADYLNVNAPVAEWGPAEMTVTVPSEVYQMTAAREADGEIQLHDRIWERMADGDVPDPEGSDRRAVVDGEVSVSPLTAPHTTEHHEDLDALVGEYRSQG